MDVPFLYEAEIREGARRVTVRVLDTHPLEIQGLGAEDCPVAARVIKEGREPRDILWDGAGFRVGVEPFESFASKVRKAQGTHLLPAQGLDPLRRALVREKGRGTIPAVSGRSPLPEGFLKAAELHGREAAKSTRGEAVASIERAADGMAVVDGSLTVRCGAPYYEARQGRVEVRGWTGGAGLGIPEFCCSATEIGGYLAAMGRGMPTAERIEVVMPDVLHLRDQRLPERHLTDTAQAALSLYGAMPVSGFTREEFDAYKRIEGLFEGVRNEGGAVRPEFVDACRELASAFRHEWTDRLLRALRRWDLANPAAPAPEAPPEVTGPGMR